MTTHRRDAEQGNQPGNQPGSRLVRRAEERGITTAEYAVGTAAGAGLAGVLYKLLTSGFGEKMLTMFFEWVLRLLGIG
jgi:hypothetical protein